MQRDIRNEPLFAEVEEFYTRFLSPGLGMVTGINDLQSDVASGRLAFVGRVNTALNVAPRTRICLLEADCAPRLLTNGSSNAHTPRWSPDGMTLAFLSDRSEANVFQPYIFRDGVIGEPEQLVALNGTVENMNWSTNGNRLLFIVAGHGANMAGMEGATTLGRRAEKASWLPIVETGREDYRWRRLWVHDFETGRLHHVATPGLTIWEASWCGSNCIAAIASRDPGEQAWYRAELVLIDVEAGTVRPLYRPSDQISLPTGRSGVIALLEAVSSDRKVMAGDVILIDLESGRTCQLDTGGVDVSGLAWRGDRLLFAGHRGLETVVGEHDPASGTTEMLWMSAVETCGEWYPSVAPVGTDACVIVNESFTKPPRVTQIRRGEETVLADFGHPGRSVAAAMLDEAIPLSWEAPDGLEIQGWYLRAANNSPPTTIMEVHGGPVYLHRPFWLGNTLARTPLSLLWRGYSVFLPNPRGSTGRGRTFAGHVRGDMGGRDTQDYLSGIDMLMARGLARQGHIGVTGSSYGGFMTCWLVTQDSRFSAAVARYPVSNWFSQHYSSAIPYFDELFLGGSVEDPAGLHAERSPVLHASKATTPTLSVAGALDQSTPPGQALEFHRALAEHGVDSAFVMYPEGVHGFLTHPAATDYVARLVHWFEHYMPVSLSPKNGTAKAKP